MTQLALQSFMSFQICKFEKGFFVCFLFETHMILIKFSSSVLIQTDIYSQRVHFSIRRISFDHISRKIRQIRIRILMKAPKNQMISLRELKLSIYLRYYQKIEFYLIK